jgi:ankyrin repeat protein
MRMTSKMTTALAFEGLVASAVLALLPCLSLASPDPNLRLPDGSTPLAWAVDSQDREKVRSLLAAGAKPNEVGTASANPLLIACQYGDPAILDMLLSAGADVKVANPGGISPLAICAGNAPAAVLKRLIATGAEVDGPDEKGQTPLMWAAAKGRIENIRLLIGHGADINRKTHKGFTPLFFALKSGEPRAPVAVLEAGGDADYIAPDGTSVVQLAIYQKDYGFAARMIERGANLKAFDRNGNHLLHAAVLADEPTLVRLLLSKGADVNALTGPSKIKMRFEVNFKSGEYEIPPKPPLLLAAERGSARVMRMLVDAGADTKFRMSDGTNIVLAAATSGKLAALELALQLEPNPNVTNSDGQTPLHLLVGGGSGTELGAMMKLLVDKGARADFRNRAGQTPADVAKDAETDAKAAFESTFGKLTVANLTSGAP